MLNYRRVTYNEMPGAEVNHAVYHLQVTLVAMAMASRANCGTIWPWLHARVQIAMKKSKTISNQLINHQIYIYA